MRHSERSLAGPKRPIVGNNSLTRHRMVADVKHKAVVLEGPLMAGTKMRIGLYRIPARRPTGKTTA